MKKKLQLVFFLFILFSTFFELPLFSGSSDAYEKLKALEGKWEGTAKWSGARTSESKMNATYSLTGNGSAVVEDLILEGERAMTSVYHLDGDVLRMTHFCAAGNQPRLKASSYEPESGRIVFEMVDITNLSKPDAPHVVGAEIVLLSPKEITVSFEFLSGGKKSTEFIQLHKVD